MSVGRPKVHASGSARSAAYVASKGVVSVPLGKSLVAVSVIAHELGVSRAELLSSMVKFALANRSWRAQGLLPGSRVLPLDSADLAMLESVGGSSPVHGAAAPVKAENVDFLDSGPDSPCE